MRFEKYPIDRLICGDLPPQLFQVRQVVMLEGAGVDGVQMAVGLAVGEEGLPVGGWLGEGELAEKLRLKDGGVLGGGGGFTVGDELDGFRLMRFGQPIGAGKNILGAHGEV